jgi:protein gp37
MSDLFHEDVPTDFIHRCFDVMNRASQHTFQVLTKRTQRLLDMAPDLPWARNIWMGTSIETAAYTWRSRLLAQVKCAVRFLSIEPLLGPIPKLPVRNINWVIVGGESGARARPMNEAWVTQIRDRCIASNVPFFFKQWGGVRKSTTGRNLQGRTWDEMPQHNGRANAEEKRSMAGAL